MIAASGQFRDLDFVLLIAFLIFALFIPDIIEGVHNYRRGKALAQRITEEHAARKALGDGWE